MNIPNHDIYLIFSCNTKGIIEQIILDTDHFFESVELPVGIHTLVAPQSIKALGDLWINVFEKKICENVRIILHANNRKLMLDFSAFLMDKKVLLSGRNAETSTELALNEMLQINNEQLNHIRSAEKKLFELNKNKKKWDVNERILNDFSLLNNELINQQRELAQKNANILQLNKRLEIANENMKMFAYSVSHDLKEPVRMVNSFMGLLQKKYGSTMDNRAQKYVSLAVDGSKRLNQMILDLLEFYRSTDIQADEIVDLNLIVDEVLGLLKNQIDERNAQVTMAKLPVIRGSHTGWRQIFQNLISNALKYVPKERSPVIHVDAIKIDHTWNVSVTDNGIGIPEDMYEQIFNIFKRAHTDEQYSGSGIGLAIVKKIVQNFDGEIQVASEIDMGTTFTIKLS